MKTTTSKIATFLTIFFIVNFIHLAGENEKMTPREKKIVTFFDQLSFSNLDLVDKFYAKDALFIDPLGKHEGVESIKGYYSNLYKNVDEISFEYDKQIVDGNTYVLPWRMKLKTASLNGGEEINVSGISTLVFAKNGKVSYHRDYFDVGEFVYEQIPVLRSIISYIKKRLKGK